jgi:hypothetical protein
VDAARLGLVKVQSAKAWAMANTGTPKHEIAKRINAELAH